MIWHESAGYKWHEFEEIRYIRSRGKTLKEISGARENPEEGTEILYSHHLAAFRGGGYALGEYEYEYDKTKYEALRKILPPWRYVPLEQLIRWGRATVCIFPGAAQLHTLPAVSPVARQQLFQYVGDYSRHARARVSPLHDTPNWRLIHPLKVKVYIFGRELYRDDGGALKNAFTFRGVYMVGPRTFVIVTADTSGEWRAEVVQSFRGVSQVFDIRKELKRRALMG